MDNNTSVKKFIVLPQVQEIVPYSASHILYLCLEALVPLGCTNRVNSNYTSQLAHGHRAVGFTLYCCVAGCRIARQSCPQSSFPLQTEATPPCCRQGGSV